MIHTHLAILGAGPTGLEASLAASAAGLDFMVFERSSGPAGNVRAWGHVRLFTPWSMNVSPRAASRLAEVGVPVPSGDDCPTGHELVDELLLPLASLEDIAANVRYDTNVVEVGRDGLLKNDEIGTIQRGQRPFRLLVERDGEEQIVFADVVLDCTGTYHNPNAMGTGGIHAPGERSVSNAITRSIPDVLSDEDSWADRRVLLVGAGASGQTVARDLARLRERRPATEVTWIIREEDPSFGAIEDDALSARADLVEAARSVLDAASGVDVRPGRSVEALRRTDAGVEVVLRREGAEGTDAVAESIVVDKIIALTGAVGDHTLYRQLQVHECWATSGPMKLSAALLASSSVDCLDQTSQGPDTLKNPEPNFFILGGKSYGRNTTFLMRVAWEQVDEIFPLIGAVPAASGTE